MTDDPPAHRTLDAYEDHADRYVERTSTDPSPLVDELLALVPRGATVLELGSGPGRDAAALEAAGLIVDRTDGANSFVARLRAEGHAARLLDVRAADFGGPYDAVFANAVLLHVDRLELVGVLATALAAVRRGGALVASFKKGEGEAWSMSKLDAPRRFVYWQEDALRAALTDAGWVPVRISEGPRSRVGERWITVVAVA